AQADEGGTETGQLLQRQKVLLRQELHVLGHAVGAAEVAAVRDGYTQVGDRAGEGVYERRHGGKVSRDGGAGKGCGPLPSSQGLRDTSPPPSAQRASAGRHARRGRRGCGPDRKSTRLNSSH